MTTTFASFAFAATFTGSIVSLIAILIGIFSTLSDIIGNGNMVNE
ncbi:MAG: hypothetical protein ACKVT0_13140 [Planctomycetaceae bacterium]